MTLSNIRVFWCFWLNLWWCISSQKLLLTFSLPSFNIKWTNLSSFCWKLWIEMTPYRLLLSIEIKRESQFISWKISHQSVFGILLFMKKSARLVDCIACIVCTQKVLDYTPQNECQIWYVFRPNHMNFYIFSWEVVLDQP